MITSKMQNMKNYAIYSALGLGIESKKSIKSIFRKIERNRFFPTDFFDSENRPKNVAFGTYFSLFKDFFPSLFAKMIYLITRKKTFHLLCHTK